MEVTKIKAEALTYIHEPTIHILEARISIHFPDRDSISTINLGTHHYEFLYFFLLMQQVILIVKSDEGEK